jgi:hypothetical protein
MPAGSERYLPNGSGCLAIELFGIYLALLITKYCTFYKVTALEFVFGP